MAEHPRLHSLPGGRDGASVAPASEARPAGATPESAPRSRPELVTVPPSPPRRPEAEPLWREVLGERLRELRRECGETLAETAGRAGVSPQYLSEIERGRKEPSSEMIAALAGALGTSLGELTTQIAIRLRPVASPARAFPLAGGRPAGPTMLAA
ncbi:helix-turn-helix domain-containing protein [Nocardia nova]|uniref:helix-turn-helix domain-containing protein n=1 Tax=Nocardia nova TaxID=37330 RepID=UPI003F541A8F